MIIDKHGRVMKKLRVQLTDACNFRCFYCMPDNVAFTPSGELLTPLEYKRICEYLIKYGVEEFRLSGVSQRYAMIFWTLCSAFLNYP